MKNAVMRPMEIKRELEEFLPVIRFEGEGLLADEGGDEILSGVQRPRAAPPRC